MGSALLLGLLLLSAQRGAPPQWAAPVQAGFLGQELELRGQQLGLDGAPAWLEVESAGQRRRISSDDPAIVGWTDRRIVWSVPDDARPGRLRVHTRRGASAWARLELYRYRSHPVPPTEGSRARPHALAVDGHGRVWLNEGFHRGFQVYDPELDAVRSLPHAARAGEEPFATLGFSDQRSWTSELGEDVLVDPHGRVWYSEGGGHLYDGRHPNFSRVVRIDPEGGSAGGRLVFPLPGERLELIGLAWDARRDALWMACGGMFGGARLARIELDAHASARYEEFLLPRADGYPAHLACLDDGSVWFTESWGNALGRLDPTTGEVQAFPLPEARSSAPSVALMGSHPWEIRASPHGGVAFCETVDNTLGRLELDASGEAVWRFWDLARADLEREQLRSIDYDDGGRLWFAQHAVRGAHDSTASVGFLTADERHVVRLPPLAGFPHEATPGAWGIAIDPRTGEVWIAESWRQRLGRITRVD